MANQTLGRYGIWSIGLRAEDPARRGELAEAAAELEDLGFGAIWLGGSTSVDHAVPLVEATSRITVATGIQSIWQHEAADTAVRFTKLDTAHPGRFLLGLGVSHAKLAEQYRRPYAAMVAYLDALDTAGVPADRRVLAALGPKMLRLSRDRAAGTHPYLVTPEHTAEARETLGEGALLAPELKVVLETDPGRARTTARAHLAFYLTSRTTPTPSSASASPRTTSGAGAATGSSTRCTRGVPMTGSGRGWTSSTRRGRTMWRCR